MSIRPLVIVVEDDEEMNHLECELLQIHGMETVSAYSGAEAIEVAGRHQADAILLDIMLPEIDGFECCRHLRARSSRRMPIIMITALDSEDSRAEGMAAGADAYFTKPFDPQEVADTVRRLVDAFRQQIGGGHNGISPPPCDPDS
ncbi:hypothetical protein LCGC14_0095030 [marine sediment metagenome]|uniref:Response regulatory domain-containing protein n=1 Tax=marine sediment metagenome TaxID=412755 RepID=A0A0F9VEJ5_9ZZZZ|nr:response regulator [Phycisphaerae bacterium]